MFCGRHLNQFTMHQPRKSKTNMAEEIDKSICKAFGKLSDWSIAYYCGCLQLVLDVRQCDISGSL